MNHTPSGPHAGLGARPSLLAGDAAASSSSFEPGANAASHKVLASLDDSRPATRGSASRRAALGATACTLAGTVIWAGWQAWPPNAEAPALMTTTLPSPKQPAVVAADAGPAPAAPARIMDVAAAPAMPPIAPASRDTHAAAEAPAAATPPAAKAPAPPAATKTPRQRTDPPRTQTAQRTRPPARSPVAAPQHRPQRDPDSELLAAILRRGQPAPVAPRR